MYPDSVYLHLKVIPILYFIYIYVYIYIYIGTLVPKYILFGYMDPLGMSSVSKPGLKHSNASLRTHRQHFSRLLAALWAFTQTLHTRAELPLLPGA